MVLVGVKLLAVKVCNCKLKNRGKGGPKEIWNIDISYPTGVGKDNIHPPFQRDENEKNINGGEKIIFELELNRGKSKIENQIENEWQGNQKRNFVLPGHQKYFAE